MTYKGIEHLKILEIEGTLGAMGPHFVATCVSSCKQNISGKPTYRSKAQMCFLRDMMVGWRRARIGTLTVRQPSSIRCPSSKSMDLKGSAKDNSETIESHLTDRETWSQWVIQPINRS